MIDDDDDYLGDMVYLLGSALFLTATSVLIGVELYSRVSQGGALLDGMNAVMWIAMLTIPMISTLILTGRTARRRIWNKPDRRR